MWKCSTVRKIVFIQVVILDSVFQEHLQAVHVLGLKCKPNDDSSGSTSDLEEI